MKFLLYFFLIYFIIRFIARFVMPIMRVTKHTSEQMRNMRDQMNNMNQGKTQDGGPMFTNPKSTASKPGDYIEYEEVK